LAVFVELRRCGCLSAHLGASLFGSAIDWNIKAATGRRESSTAYSCVECFARAATDSTGLDWCKSGHDSERCCRLFHWPADLQHLPSYSQQLHPQDLIWKDLTAGHSCILCYGQYQCLNPSWLCVRGNHVFKPGGFVEQGVFPS
jgi:hypothetical protein